MIDLLPALHPIVLRVRPDVTWRKHNEKTRCERERPLTEELLREHLRGYHLHGVCPLKENESAVEIALLDLDSHFGELEWEEMKFVALKVIKALEEKGIKPVAFRSSGGRGVHLFMIWDKPQDAHSVREFLRHIIESCGFSSGTKGVARGEIEIFPKQDKIPAGGVGNMFLLPLAAKSAPIDFQLCDFEVMPPEYALKIEWEFSQPVPFLAKSPKELAVVKRKHYNGSVNILRNALEFCQADTDYDEWLKIGMGLHQETGGSAEGLTLWDDWSSKGGTKYPGFDLLEKKWLSFEDNKEKPVTAGFIKMRASEKGWTEDYSGDFDDITARKDVIEADQLTSQRFNIVSAIEFASRPAVKWIIKGILPRAKLALAYGGSGDGKTFVILDMSLAIALGIDWNSRRVTRGRVIYICAEGVGGFTTRLAAYGVENNINFVEAGSHFGIIPDTPNFRTDKDVKTIATKIEAWGQTDLIIIDTLAQVTPGADENTAKDMSVALRNAEMLHTLTGATVLLIHHAGKDPSRGARGWSGLKAPLDAEFEISREGEERKFWIEKMKDGRDGFGWGFHLKTLALGLDEDSDQIDSCTVQTAET